LFKSGKNTLCHEELKAFVIRSSRFRDNCNVYRCGFNGDTQMRFACWV